MQGQVLVPLYRVLADLTRNHSSWNDSDVLHPVHTQGRLLRRPARQQQFDARDNGVLFIVKPIPLVYLF